MGNANNLNWIEIIIYKSVQKNMVDVGWKSDQNLLIKVVIGEKDYKYTQY